MGIFNKKKRWGNFNGNINIYDDLKPSDIPELIEEKDIHSLQFFEFKNPKKRTWNALYEFYEKYPKIGLRIVWYDQINFDFYSQLPSLRNFDISSFNTSDYTPLLLNKKLTDLAVGETKSTAVNLSFIKEFKDLTSLWIDGMKKGLENAAELSKLERLTFRGVKMNDLNLINSLNNLVQLRLLFGSYKNLDAIANVKSIKTLEISRTRQIPNYDFLKSMDNLNSLYFEGMSKMESLPDLSGLKNLKRIQIDNNSRLTDITNINQLPNLEIFLLFFPENFKAAYRKELFKQATNFLLNSKTVKYTNLFFWLEDDMKEKLKEKGIKKWDYGMNI
ncbi:hypothetical protein [Aquimarina algiphila]|uniref:Leucine-rich repeat domain-containing protein n=1 Tax=Aquimarina algiphila TaxID=2047982 RepID=A0A554V9Z3_9FLAO|nr:hypothetical protein [Aquimarina algiphila]TSE02380.1 hypothetical protein FOF46_30910 [Aquimarina algiphila]